MNIYSDMVEEHTTHSLEDSIKILEYNVVTLREEACHYESTSFETFKKPVTLTKTTIHDNHRCKNIERRSTQIPGTWDDRLLMLK